MSGANKGGVDTSIASLNRYKLVFHDNFNDNFDNNYAATFGIDFLFKTIQYHVSGKSYCLPSTVGYGWRGTFPLPDTILHS
jgi:hypothetical protein